MSHLFKLVGPLNPAVKFTFPYPNLYSGMPEFKLMAKIIGHVRVRVRFGHKSGQVDNFAVSFFVSKIDRGDLSKSLRAILFSEVLIKARFFSFGSHPY